jgi:enolase
MTKIKTLHAREILDSRGNPTVEVDVKLDNGVFARAAVPSGASTGSREAVELRDKNQKVYKGRGVLSAVQNVNKLIAEKLCGMDALNQNLIDQTLIELDATEDKHTLGANAILGVSLAVARGAALSLQKPLYKYISENLVKKNKLILPTPMFNIMNGGAHADNNIDLQEFMIAPVGATNFHEAVRFGAETYQTLKEILKKKNLGTGVGDEGGFAPNIKSNTQAIEVILEAITQAGFHPGKDIVLALDPASSEFYEDGFYVFNKSDKSRKTSDEMIEFYSNWIRQYPILSIEDGLAEGDWDGWKNLTLKLNDKIQIVGDDIFVTNTKVIQKAISLNVANASLIKLNQIGTLTETLAAIELSQSANYGTVISHRSGETWDDFIADLAVATGAGQIKSGAPCRGERVAKYNQLMRIEEELGKDALFAGIKPFIRN